MTQDSLSVSELMARVQRAVVAELPTPVWVRGEVTGYRRTSGGAAFFRLADPDDRNAALEVSGRGRIMQEIEHVLGDAGLGNLGDGVELRMRGTVEVDPRRSAVRMALLEIDPSFTAGRLALERARVVRAMTADGSITANRNLPIPLVPLRLGLVTSRGSAAHADFLDHLERSRFRFTVRTAHTSVQGEHAPGAIAAALSRLATEPVDAVAVVRGGGSQLELAVFDTEVVGRAIATMPVPVITGIGHEVDRTVADEAAAVAEKTPTAAAEWLVTRVQDFAGRLDGAREHIRREAQTALQRHHQVLGRAASDVAAARTGLARQGDGLTRLRQELAGAAREGLTRHRTRLQSLTEWFSAIDVGPTLQRGFALVTTPDGATVVRSVSGLAPGDSLLVRLADGTVRVTVEEQ
jgi:exodeoxyribonuclease VII large subunit